jgi:hypothetical protein
MTRRDLGKIQAALAFALALGALLAAGLGAIGQGLGALIMIGLFVIVGFARIITLPGEAE